MCEKLKELFKNVKRSPMIIGHKIVMVIKL